MIFEFQNFGDFTYVMQGMYTIGTFTQNKNGILLKTWTTQPVAKAAGIAVCAMYNQSVVVQPQHSLSFQISGFNSNENIFILMHTDENEKHDRTLFHLDEKIGTVSIKRRLILDTTEEYKKAMTENRIEKFNNILANAVYDLAQASDANVEFNIYNREYVVSQKTRWQEIDSMCFDKTQDCYYQKRIVGTYKYTKCGIDFKPLHDVSLPRAVDGALALQIASGRPVNFKYKNKAQEILVKHYIRHM